MSTAAAAGPRRGPHVGQYAHGLLKLRGLRYYIPIGLVVLAVTALGPLCAGATFEPAPTPDVTISPLPGTPDALPSTQISFLGAPTADLRDISVVGSRSGRHGGRLERYRSAPGGSFLPARPFKEGEHVTVSATLRDGTRVRELRTSFTVARPYALPHEDKQDQPADGPGAVQRFRSEPGFEPAAVDVLRAAPKNAQAATAKGDIFLAPDSGPGQEGPMIVEPDGQLVWFKPMPEGTWAMNLRVQRYRGRPVLTWWQGEVVDGHGQGEDVIYNTSYRRIATIHAGNGLYADLHEFDLNPKGNALITAYVPEHMDLSGIGGRRNGLINDCAFQEIDTRTGLVMFEWHALGHVPLSESHARVPHLQNGVYDFFHINSIQEQADGNFLIDSRNTWTAYMIDHNTGHALWRLGGRHSTFKLGPRVRFAWQHDAEVLPDGKISIFDDEDTPPEAKSSRAIVLSLNESDHTASLLRQLIHPGVNLLTQSQGNAQELPNGEEFVGWGQAGFTSQFSRDGDLIFDMRLPKHDSSYRAYRYPWNGSPTGRPALAVSGDGAGDTVYASWNGATGVRSWRVLVGSSRGSLAPVGTYPRRGFETAMSVKAGAGDPWFAVQALGADGSVLATSQAVRH